MSQDPAGRTLLFWEAFEPSPPPRPETRYTDPRIARVRKGIAAFNAVAPRIAAAHAFDAEDPEECNDLFAQRFVAAYLAFLFDVPGYFDWLAEQDLVASYREFRRQLQHLSLYVRADHWVLKAPAHLFALDAILTVFPDACIVQTHRDPLQAVPSVCSLLAALRGISSDRVDLRRLGAEMTEALAAGTDRALDARAAADPARFFDVPYPTLLADPVGTVRDACRHFGYAFDAELRDAPPRLDRRQPAAQARRPPLQPGAIRARSGHRQRRVRQLPAMAGRAPGDEMSRARRAPRVVRNAHADQKFGVPARFTPRHHEPDRMASIVPRGERLRPPRGPERSDPIQASRSHPPRSRSWRGSHGHRATSPWLLDRMGERDGMGNLNGERTEQDSVVRIG